mmetsp:Transcript_21986/g.48263  ORF Transcript_21986/g.48263 Transcript_21986/m.48263 type:complete len:245 (-) Transcript_21986:930-1664(-)
MCTTAVPLKRSVSNANTSLYLSILPLKGSFEKSSPDGGAVLAVGCPAEGGGKMRRWSGACGLRRSITDRWGHRRESSMPSPYTSRCAMSIFLDKLMRSALGLPSLMVEVLWLRRLSGCGTTALSQFPVDPLSSDEESRFDTASPARVVLPGGYVGPLGCGKSSPAAGSEDRGPRRTGSMSERWRNRAMELSAVSVSSPARAPWATHMAHVAIAIQLSRKKYTCMSHVRCTAAERSSRCACSILV